MRFKLVLLTSLAGALIGAGASIGLIRATLGSWMKTDDPAFSAHGWTAIVIYMIPLTIALLGGVFAYRHTARKRKLHAVITAILVLLLCLVAYVAFDYFRL